jgi:ABC-type multidrug transport system ATPase subunit
VLGWVLGWMLRYGMVFTMPMCLLRTIVIIEPSSMNLPHILQADALCFGYPECTIVDALSLRLPAGVSLVLGDDGSGKTTLLRILAGDLAVKSGQLQICGVDIACDAKAYRQQVCWVDSRAEAFDALTPADYFAQAQQQYPHWSAPALQDLITGLSLEPHMHKSITMLSTGTKRKVWLAAAFASGAALVLLDDPLAALDKPSIRYVIQQLQAAALQSERAFVVAQYETLADVRCIQTINLNKC